MKANSNHIMIIEDNEGDILLTTEVLEESAHFNKISVATDGDQALKQLYLWQSKNENLPDLILLDINLPKRNGHEVLAKIKGALGLAHIPVIMLTTSNSPKDIMLAYKNHANCFITKPIEVNGFMNVIGDIENFWLRVARLPNIKN